MLKMTCDVQGVAKASMIGFFFFIIFYFIMFLTLIISFYYIYILFFCCGPFSSLLQSEYLLGRASMIGFGV